MRLRSAYLLSMNDMSEKYIAVITDRQKDSESELSVFTCEYEKDGVKQTATYKDGTHMIVDVGSTIEITVENGQIIDTNVDKIVASNSIFMLVCLFIFLTVIVLLFVWFVKTRFIAVRIGIGVFAAAFYIFTHIPSKQK